MKLSHPLLLNAAGLVAAGLVRRWMDTLGYRAAFYDASVDPASPSCRGAKIYLFWHEYLLFPINLRGHCNLTMLLSQHRDAEILGRAARHLGFDVVRGSTTRGGTAALKSLLREGRHRHLTITPDGPRGPRRSMAQGPIYLASKLELPLVLIGMGYDRPWRLSSWDRFAIPRPYSRGRAVVSPPIHVPPRLDRDQTEHFRRAAEALLNRLTREAEAWAEAGTRKPGEVPIRRARAASRVLL